MGRRFFPHLMMIVLGVMAMVAIVFSGGCAVRTSSGTHFFWQRGVVLQLIHTCTDKAVIYQAGRGLRATVNGASPVDISLEPVVPGEQQVHVTVQSINTAGNVAATFTESFYIDSRSTTTQTWTIGDGGWSGGRQARCPR